MIIKCTHTDKIIKSKIKKILMEKFDGKINITEDEWNIALLDSLNDIYANKLCMKNTVSYDYFISIMVTRIELIKKLPYNNRLIS